MKNIVVNIFCKCFILLLMLSNSNAEAQEIKPKLLHDPGIYMGANWSKGNNINYVPQAWFYVSDFYVETRYNYEDEKTFSVYLGRPFEIEELKMEVTPTVGLVFGNFEGYALGLNSEFATSHLSGFTENEYCFSSVNTNFFFSWAGFTTPLVKNVNIGASWQYTLEPFSSVFDVGPMMSFNKKAFGVQLFAYNPWKDNRYWQVGVSFDLGARE